MCDLGYVTLLDNFPFTFKQIVKKTVKDKILDKIFEFTKDGWPSKVEQELSNYFARRNKIPVVQNCLIWNNRVIIPEFFQETMLKELQHGAHPGVKMKSLAPSYIWWDGIDQDIETAAKMCTSCQDICKQPPIATVHAWEWTSQLWKRIHIDFAGPFMGHMFLVLVDAHSRWSEIQIENITTDVTMDALTELFSRYGICDTLVSDNGATFDPKSSRSFSR